MRARRRDRPTASVQELLPLEETVGDAVRLRDGALRAVLEASPVDLALMPDEEREAVLAGYRRFLNGLSHPLQLVVRVVPAGVEGYLAGLGDPARRSPGLRRLARDHESFVRALCSERAPLARRFLVVVPSEPAPGAGRPRAPWPWGRGNGGASAADDVPASLRRLSLRCAEVARALAACGVGTRRLGGPELLALFRESLGAGPLPHRPSAGTGPVVTAPADGG